MQCLLKWEKALGLQEERPKVHTSADLSIRSFLSIKALEYSRCALCIVLSSFLCQRLCRSTSLQSVYYINPLLSSYPLSERALPKMHHKPVKCTAVGCFNAPLHLHTYQWLNRQKQQSEQATPLTQQNKDKLKFDHLKLQGLFTGIYSVYRLWRIKKIQM